MSTYNRLDLQTLGIQPIIMPKNLPDHWPWIVWTNMWIGVSSKLGQQLSSRLAIASLDALKWNANTE